MSAPVQQSTELALLTAALALSYIAHRRRQQPKSDLVAAELEKAEAHVVALRAQLQRQPGPTLSIGRKDIRIFMDGAFDLFHYGHANAFRQGLALGTYLVVGVNDDVSITECKGAPLCNDEERLAMVRGCKFVDEVVERVPYVMTDEYLNYVIQKYRIDFVVHGDDPCIVNGKDVYASAQALGKYRTIPRTEGISTTEIVGRMLTTASDGDNNKKSSNKKGGAAAPLNFVRDSHFMTSTQMLFQFAGQKRKPPAGARVVYVDGGWDMFHAAHVHFLEAAAKLGDYLLVGVHADSVLHNKRGANYPILNLNERVLSVLACSHVDDVVIAPPRQISKEMLAALKVSLVAHGSVHSGYNERRGLSDPYEVPKQMGLFRELPSQGQLTVESIVQRINDNHERFASKVARKMKSEQEYYDARYGFDGETVEAPKN
jgi:ethanolamine-phosphate cytidylyltransferase